MAKDVVSCDGDQSYYNITLSRSPNDLEEESVCSFSLRLPWWMCFLNSKGIDDVLLPYDSIVLSPPKVLPKTFMMAGTTLIFVQRPVWSLMLPQKHLFLLRWPSIRRWGILCVALGITLLCSKCLNMHLDYTRGGGVGRKHITYEWSSKTKWLLHSAKGEDALWKNVINAKYGVLSLGWWSKRSPYAHRVDIRLVAVPTN